MESLLFTEIKSLQLEVVLAIATGQDVFGVLQQNWIWQESLLCLPSYIARTSDRNVQR